MPCLWVLHIELFADIGADQLRALHVQAALLHRKSRAPVETAAVLLAERANSRLVTGEYSYGRPGVQPTTVVRYNVLRLWDISAEQLLAGELGVAPLAVLGKLADGDPVQTLEPVCARIIERTTREAKSIDEARRMQTAAFLLAGLRVPSEVVERLIMSVDLLKESSTYRAIFERGARLGEEHGRQEGRSEGLGEGRVQQLQQAVLHLGTRRLGEPPAELRSRILAVRDIDQLQVWFDRMIDSPTWNAAFEMS